MTENPEIGANTTIINSEIGRYCSIGNEVVFCYSQLGDYSYLSGNSRCFSSKIGKFTQISWNVSINPANHDYKRTTSHPMLFAKKFGFLPDDKPFYRQYDECVIGNDVWIGCNSLIMGGVHIGDGAVIGAGARISHDVPPYAIVIGNNDIIKMRFGEAVVQALEEFQWWNLPDNKIKQIIHLMAETPTVESIALMKELTQ